MGGVQGHLPGFSEMEAEIVKCVKIREALAKYFPLVVVFKSNMFPKKQNQKLQARVEAEGEPPEWFSPRSLVPAAPQVLQLSESNR